MSDTYGMAVTEQERADTLARVMDAEACSQPACRLVMEKPGRGVEARPVWHQCERHQAEFMERHQRAMADYRAAQAAKPEAP